MERRRAFTLVELMVVVAIVGLLSTAVAVGVMHHLVNARLTLAATGIRELDRAAELFQLDTGRAPRSFDELWERPGDVQQWGPDPYVKHPHPPRDPWKHDYVFERRGRQVVFTSYGADGAPGGEGEDADLDSLGVREVR